MNNLVDRVYVHAKIHALHGYLLSRDDYQEIVRSGKLQAAFPEIPGKIEQANIIQAKEAIFRHHIEKFILLIGLNARYGDFLRAFLLLFELSNIKQVMLKAFGKIRLFPQWNDVSPYNIIAADSGKEEIGPGGLRALFAGTIFEGVMDFDETPSYEELESAIDFLTLKNLMRFSDRRFPADAKVFNDIMIRKALSLRILWERRCGLQEGWVFPQFNLMDMFDGHGVTRQEINAVEKDIGRHVDAEGAMGGTGDISRLELSLNRLFMKSVNAIFSKDFHSIRPVVSYAWSLYYEIINLFMILEGFNLRVNPDVILQRLVWGE